MEEDLILIGSHYINSDKEMRLATLFTRKQSKSEVILYLQKCFSLFFILMHYYYSLVER